LARQAFHGEGCRGAARKSEDGLTNDRSDLIAKTKRPRKHHFACAVLTDTPAGFLTL
jgi:hypothetical protein